MNYPSEEYLEAVYQLYHEAWHRGKMSNDKNSYEKFSNEQIKQRFQAIVEEWVKDLPSHKSKARKG